MCQLSVGLSHPVGRLACRGKEGTHGCANFIAFTSTNWQQTHVVISTVCALCDGPHILGSQAAFPYLVRFADAGSPVASMQSPSPTACIYVAPLH